MSQFIKLEIINSKNINIAKDINNLLFPLTYSPSFYKHLIEFESTKGYFFMYKNNIIGTCTFTIKESNKLKECYIMTFGILKDYRNIGLGSSCIKFIEKYVIDYYNCELIKLHVHTSNFKGINFYKKNKYLIHTIEKDYYRNINPSSAYCLIKKFTK